MESGLKLPVAQRSEFEKLLRAPGQAFTSPAENLGHLQGGIGKAGETFPTPRQGLGFFIDLFCVGKKSFRSREMEGSLVTPARRPLASPAFEHDLFFEFLFKPLSKSALFRGGNDPVAEKDVMRSQVPFDVDEPFDPVLPIG